MYIGTFLYFDKIIMQIMGDITSPLVNKCVHTIAHVGYRHLTEISAKLASNYDERHI